MGHLVDPFAAFRQLALWTLLLLPARAAQMPYNPTQLLKNDSLIYVFQPSANSPSQFELGSVDISSHIDASNPPYTTLYPTLPFLNADETRPFNALLDNGGNLTVYTGDCASGASGGQVWSFTPGSSEKNGNGSWTQENITFPQNAKRASSMGPSYLSGGMSFSTIVGGDAMNTDAYFFGGMCPFEDKQKNDWQSAANYSNLMITLEPSQKDVKPLNYQLSVSSSRGPPIAEAGFTLTGLSPLFSNQSDGTQTQQQNFVLVAGHTSSAFINTSQVAVFSLPQQGWTFIPVSQPDTSRTDLSIRSDVKEIEPRSGHSAVLTPDGTRLVVFGGWIGDNETPAEPQLAILNIGNGYGGQGDWEWVAPTTSGSGLLDGSGIYGHGAAMLPGGVMMVMGGWSMSAPSSRSRRASTITNTKNLFFNVSSSSWIADYTPPPKLNPSEPVEGGPLSSPSQRAGLGAGLGIGMATVFGLMVFYLWYTRRLKKQREMREQQLQELAMGAHRYNLDCMSPGFDSRGGRVDMLDTGADSEFYSSVGVNQDEGWRRAKGADAERTGLLVEIPSPTRGLRRGMSGRPAAPMPRYDERRVRGSGNIHPIDELDEEQEQSGVNDRTPLTSQPEMTEQTTKQSASIFDNAPILDPFIDSDRRGRDRRTIFHSAPSSPIQDDTGTPDWLLPVTAPTARHSSRSPDGRTSPTRSSERTGSNLSERSTRSNLSSPSITESIRHSASIRASAIINSAVHANPFKTPDDSPTTDAPIRGVGGWRTPVDPRTRSFTSIRSSGRPGAANADGDSFTTARSSFMTLQAEGEVLLGGNPERARPGTSSTSDGSTGVSGRDTAASMSHADTVTAATSIADGFTRPGLNPQRRKSWLGSVRRALSRSAAASDRTRSLTNTALHIEPYTDDPSPAQAHVDRSKRRSLPSSAPRRAASDASFWNSKRGKQDWLDDELDVNDPRAKWRRTSGDNWGAPEDVALAEKERQRREWRERGNLLINLTDDNQLPTPRTPIHPGELGVPTTQDRPRTPADEDDWDVEAAVERRVVQVMFTVPKSRLRVVNADVDNSSILSLPTESSKERLDTSNTSGSPKSNTPSRVKDLAGRFEQLSSPELTPRASPRPSPSPSIKSLKIRAKRSSPSLPSSARSSSAMSNGKTRAPEKERTGAL